MPYINILRLVATIMIILIHTCSVGESNIPADEEYAYGLLKHIGVFAVPLFAMISGCFFLDPKRNVTIQTMLNKYCKRILLVLLCFALPMCLSEAFITKESLWVGLYNFVRGHSWIHMWYMYMLICLYLLTPLIRTFIVNSSKREIEYTLAVLFVLTIIVPSLRTYGIQLQNYLTLGTPFIFYYILGYYLAHIETLRLSRTHCGIMVVGYILIIATLETGGFAFSQKILQYHDINRAFGAASIFLLFKRIDLNWSIANNLRVYCFAIYLVHTFFTNLAYKFLHIMPSNVASPWISLPLFTAIIFLASLVMAYLLRQIRFLRKHVV